MLSMAYRYQYRAVKKQQKKSRQNFIITLIIIIILLYGTFFWILPFVISSIGAIRNSTNPSGKVINPTDQETLAPPVLNIPFEATNSSQINISGYGSPGSKVELFIDDDKKQTVTVNSDGSFDINDISLTLGINNIYGKSVDDSGKESLASKIISLTYDNKKPLLQINEPDDNKQIQGGDKKVKISGRTDPGIKVFINNNQVILDKDGNFSSDESINEGDNNFDIKAVDLALNTSQISRKVNYKP